MSKPSVAVEIAGQQYRIRSDADEQSLHRLAAYVDRAMDRVRAGTGTADSLDVAVLTCLNLAREILSLREQRSATVEDQRLRALIERVERAAGDVSGNESRSGGDGADQAPADDSAGSETVEVETSSEPVAAEGARTLDLPSVEALRERASSSEDSLVADASDLASDLPEARVAAGGRERAS